MNTLRIPEQNLIETQRVFSIIKVPENSIPPSNETEFTVPKTLLVTREPQTALHSLNFGEVF